MPKPKPPSRGAALRFLRFSAGWSEVELAEALGVSPTLISDYEKGRKTLLPERLAELLAVMGIAPEAVDACQFAHEVAFPQEGPDSPVEPRPAARRHIYRLAAAAGQRATEATWKKLTANVRRLRTAQARLQAEELWEVLKKLPTTSRRAAVEAEGKYWTWALAERLCVESVRAAAHRADRASELAQVALRVADLAPGADVWQKRIQGYVWAFVGNARRVHGDLPGAEQAFACSDRLWQAGASADPGVLDGFRLLDLKASLRRQQGHFDEALALLDRALSASPTEEARVRILIKKAATLTRRGDDERAIEVLRKAESLLLGVEDPRLPWLVQFNLATTLSDLGRYTEGEALLPGVRELATGLGNELDLVRVIWLNGRVAAGLDRREEAVSALEKVRRYFTIKEIAYDAALAVLELAVLYLERERIGEVKRLAEELRWVFQAQGVHKEALAALRLFCEAARQEEATVELTREILRYLDKARHNPELRFQG